MNLTVSFGDILYKNTRKYLQQVKLKYKIAVKKMFSYHHSFKG